MSDRILARRLYCAYLTVVSSIALIGLFPQTFSAMAWRSSGASHKQLIDNLQGKMI